jgi:hypothetical protein
MLPRAWAPVPVEDLVLVGPRGDGGYVACAAAIAPVTLLISMGLSDDWRFEEDILRRTNARVECFDHSVTPAFWFSYTMRALRHRRFGQIFRFLSYSRFFSSDKAHHRRLMIGSDGPGAVSLDTIIAPLPESETLFLKMDIEGGEYAILDQIIAARHRFTGMVMELHEVDQRRAEIAAFLEGLSDFTIVAMHPNNYFGADANGDPYLLEVSLMRNDFVKPNPSARAPVLPPTIADKPDVTLIFG